jgi:hypothetical protein
MKIFDDVLSEKSKNEVENFLLNEDFPWFLIKKSSGKTEKIKGFVDTIQFEHHFIQDSKIHSQAIHYLMKILDWNNIVEKTKISPAILRMKSNLLLKTQITPNTPHIDFLYPHTVLLYYVNDSDGPTIFYHKQKNNHFEIIDEVTPKKGRIVIFDGGTYHSSTPPQKNDCRCVINFNLNI